MHEIFVYNSSPFEIDFEGEPNQLESETVSNSHLLCTNEANY